LTAEAAYRQGYLGRADRHEKFHRNENMKILQSLDPGEGVKQFIRQFFSHLAGKYELSIADASKDEAPGSDRANTPRDMGEA